MARPDDEVSFFIGYDNRVPRPLALFLILFAAAFLSVMAGLALFTGASVNDPGDGRFAWEDGQQRLAGVLRLEPYPVLHVPASADRPARAILLSGQGKRGVKAKAATLTGQPVEAGGILLKRGTIDMLQVGGQVGLRSADDAAAGALGTFSPAEPVALGRWRLVGEICDGKCYQGAMRPGRGLAHKACANLCLIGTVPPVFVSSGAVDGQSFFLLADEAGGPLPASFYDLVALMIEVEGDVERRDNLLVFKVDLSSAKVL